MKTPKDLFSKQSKLYVKFRPHYPDNIYEWLVGLTDQQKCAWDCGTGNGQVAQKLAPFFDKIHATDISSNQLKQAPEIDNIVYEISKAESTPFADNTFDLITVAQAIHWFDLKAFYKEAERVLKPQGILAVWGYGLVRIENEIDHLLDHYYKEVIGPYWAPERKHIDQHYDSILFPWSQLSPDMPLYIEVEWELNEFEGYLNTWSSLQTFLKEREHNPVDAFIEDIRKTGKWIGKRKVRFPIFTKVGRNKKEDGVV